MKSANIFLLLSSVLVFSACNNGTTNTPNIPEENDDEENIDVWPTEQIQQTLAELIPGCTEIIPAFNNATSVEINDENLELDEYFGIYCYTEDANAANEYIEILQDNNWDVKTQVIENFYQAFSPNEQVWLNFNYFPEFHDLEIYVTEAVILEWPTEKISSYVKKINDKATDAIPSFEADFYVVNYHESLMRLAINGYGVSETIESEYKTKVEELRWETRVENHTDGYFAVSQNKQLEINFYYNESSNEFNIDVSLYKENTSNWPKDSIDSVISSLGLEGTIEEYVGENKGFKVDTDFFPACVFVYVNSEQDAIDGAASYNQMLLTKGYTVCGTLYGEAAYLYPGTTLAYRAAYLYNGNIVTIEFFGINDLDKK